MRKRLLALLAVITLFGSVSGYAYDEGIFTHVVRSTGSNQDTPVRIYQLVRYPENAPNSVGLSNGDVVAWDCVSDDGVTVNLVATATSVDAVAGVIVGANSAIYSKSIPTADNAGVSSVTANTDVGRRNWGYMQVYGLHTTTNVTAGGVAGSSLIMSATARYATVPSNGVGSRTLGFVYDAASQGQSEVFITTE